MNQGSIKKVDTSQVLLDKDGQKKSTYYFPCYVRFLVKEIESVDQKTIQASVSGTLIFSFYYGGVETKIIDRFIDNPKRAILLEFNQEESLQLRQDKGITLKRQQEEKIITFTIRKTFKADIKGQIFWAPFMIINIYFLVTIQSLTFTYNQKQQELKQEHKGKDDQSIKDFLKKHRQENKKHDQQITVKMNCMDNKQILLLRNSENLSFGSHQIAPYYFDTKYTSVRKYPFQDDGTVVDNKDYEQEKSLNYFQYAHFKISVFQYPMNSVLVVFIPLWMLGLIGLFTFFQEQSFGARLATIAVLVLAYVPLISTINEKIPPTPKIKLIQIMILFQLLGTIILLIQSFQIRNLDPYVFVWYDSWYYLAYASINLLTFIIIFSLYIIHRVVWVPKYMQKSPENKYRKKEKKIDRNQWRNKHCDDEFTAQRQKNPKFKPVKVGVNA